MSDLLPYNSPKARAYRGAATKRAKAPPKKAKPTRKRKPTEEEVTDITCVPSEYLAELERRPRRCPTPTRTAPKKHCGCPPPSGAGRADAVAKKRKKRKAPSVVAPTPRGRRKAQVIPPHRAAQVSCLKCGAPHTLSEHISHKYGQGKGRWPK